MSLRTASAIDLRLLRQFVAVAEELHFRRAARRLAMSQPPLTAAIRRLEDEIGTVLIERGRKTIALTAAGGVLLDEARAVLVRAERAVTMARDAAAGRIGNVRLGYVGSAMYGRLPATIRTFRREHRHVRLELHEATTVAQIAALRTGDLDLAIVVPPFGEKGGLSTDPFDTDRLAMALPTGHPLAAKRTLELADLAHEPFVLWPASEGRGFHDLVIRLCAQAGFAPTVTQEAHSLHGVLSLVAVETGVSIVPTGMASVRPQDVAYHTLDSADAAFDLVVCRREGDASPASQALLAALIDRR